jgi:hypothetical protein
MGIRVLFSLRGAPEYPCEKGGFIMAEQILVYIWIIVASLSAVALAFLIMILWEIRKMVSSLGIVVDGVSYLRDFFRFLKIFRRKRRSRR